METIETTFHQDLNGDGVIGLPPSVPPPSSIVIEAFGSTSLMQVGSNFYLYNSSGSGPSVKYAGAPLVAGGFGAWSAIGAEQTSSGYDVAFKANGADIYTVWATDSTGNYVSSVVISASGTSTALESIETTFHQDLNGDGTIGVPAATNPAIAALAGAQSGSTTFDGTTLTLETASTMHSQMIGFTGDGTLQGSDQIDLRGMNYNSIHSGFDAAIGTLVVSDRSTTLYLQFLGHYSKDSFQFANDGSDGTLVYGSSGQPPPPGADAAVQAAGSCEISAATIGGQDTFVFAPHFGNVTLTNFNSTTDTIQISQTIFANMSALLAGTRDDGNGNAVITDAAHDTITIQQLTVAQLLAHQGDFHFV